MKLKSVRTHHDSQRHVITVTLKATEPKPSASAYEACSSKQNAFNMELADAFVAADIPFDKLRNPNIKRLLTKYMRQIIPEPSSLAKSYVKKSFQHKIEMIRTEVCDAPILLEVDESSDVEGRKIVHAIVRPLFTDHPGIPRLFHSRASDEATGATIQNFVLESLLVLWPQGIHFDRLLLYNTDGVNYMMTSTTLLQPLFLKIIYNKCICHSFRLVAEEICQCFVDANELISETKKVFLKAPTRRELFRQLAPGIPFPPRPATTRWATWLRAATYYNEHFAEVQRGLRELYRLEAESINRAQVAFTAENIQRNFAHIRDRYSCIASTITKLETQNLSPNQRVPLIEMTRRQISHPRDIPERIKRKLRRVFVRNPGYEILKNNNKYLIHGGQDPGLPGWTQNDYECCRFASLGTVDVERSFSKYKKKIAHDRRSFKIGNLLMHVLINCFMDGFVLDDDSDNEDEEDDLENNEENNSDNDSD